MRLAGAGRRQAANREDRPATGFTKIEMHALIFIQKSHSKNFGCCMTMRFTMPRTVRSGIACGMR